MTVLDDHASDAEVAAATLWATETLAAPSGAVPADLRVQQLARALLAHAKLRAVPLTPQHASPAGQPSAPERAQATALSGTPAGPPVPAATPSAAPSAASAVATSGSPSQAPPQQPTLPVAKVPRQWGWSHWRPSTRMAVQAIIAASIAMFIGEAISSAHWYWAIITVFIIFSGAATRSSILTKAFRRVAGTAIGIVAGFIIVTLIGDHTPVIVIACILAVFCMLYFGPLNYTYSPLFISIMLVCFYHLTGLLNHSIMELRVGETLLGAVVGVLCAYFIMTTSSRPALVAQVDAYFDALDYLLRTVAGSLTSACTREEVANSLHQLDTAQAAVDRSLSSMSTAFIVDSPREESDAVHLMYIATRASAQLAQAAQAGPNATSSQTEPGTQQVPGAQQMPGARVISAAITEVLVSSEAAHHALSFPNEPEAVTAEQQLDRPNILSHIDQLPGSADDPATHALMALARTNWALHHITDRDATHA
ncbi:hypothetical protein JOF28_000094 [Leucobacter exalbidus]|uniref:Integral membrane bound transporter domain-containing protein n=1 Tax=Leucobacter exalbidus TaxID=662960 RepID=A0A940PJ72_9MICO|nr:FUSC family protein [Leucobacter exalbidus]MBP1324862.1 hypothetical protein [Leucobacter exalbidus]